MSKAPTSARPADTAAVEPDQLTLTEFCIRLSEKVRRPELISGFEYSERASGKIKDTAEAFQARFDAFLNTPV